MSCAESRDATVFHLTHGKAGSQWVYQVLDALFPHRIVCPQELHGQLHHLPIEEGGIYPTVYLPRAQFESLNVPAHHRKFFVMRDLRDTLVSLYFSIKKSHMAQAHDPVSRLRTAMKDMTEEQGMEYLFPLVSEQIAKVQLSWLGGDVPIYRYEDALQDPMEFFGRMLDHCELKTSHAMLRNAVDAMSFENRSRRRRGEEDRDSHYRRGLQGDWQNHLKGELLEKLYARFASVLVKTGYAPKEFMALQDPHYDVEEMPHRHGEDLGMYAPGVADIIDCHRRMDFARLHKQWVQRSVARPEHALQQDVLITGTGWYPAEAHEGEPFCWVADEARLIVRRPSGTMMHLSLDLEPGPSMCNLPAKLWILGQDERPIAMAELSMRQSITLDLSPYVAGAGEDWVLTFVVEDGGIALAGDARTMSYRVFRFGWTPAMGPKQDAWGMEASSADS